MQLNTSAVAEATGAKYWRSHYMYKIPVRLPPQRTRVARRSDARLYGYALMYGKTSSLITKAGFGDFFEILSPGCFAGTLTDVPLLMGHDTKQVISRTGHGLTLTDGKIGLRFEANVNQADLPFELIPGRRRGMSFQFSHAKWDWSTRCGQRVGLLKSAQLEHIAIVSNGSYKQAYLQMDRNH